ncbi:MAG: poly-gamma-glutamate capsule biosynthesis protein CapA/YwtB (metallophosphatase superfamily) [Cyclobacteriaceae bacterium]
MEEEVDIEITRLLPDTFSLMAVGDIMNGTNYPNKSYLPLNQGSSLWNSSCDLLKSADLTFGNVEGTILNGEGQLKNCNNPKTCYLFRMPVYMTKNFSDCGFDLMSTANNHANDFGEEGRSATAQALDSFNIAYAGSTTKHFTILKKNHLRIGLVAFVPNKGTLTFYDENYAQSLIQELDTLVDIVIVSIHGGAEGAKNQHVTNAPEFYFGENRGNIYDFSRKMIDSGADIILGHGPHVPRAIDIYKDRLIVYSLGNFLTYSRFNLKNENALAPILHANLNAEGIFLSGKIYSFRQSYTLGPLFDDRNRAALKIKGLTEEDFPESQIYIDEEGIISYLQN